MHRHTCAPALTLSERLLSIVVKGMNTNPMTCKTARENGKIRSAHNKQVGTYSKVNLAHTGS